MVPPETVALPELTAAERREARRAGHPVRWSRLDAAENVEASRAAHRGDDGPLRAMLDRLVDGAGGTGAPGPRTPAD